MHIDMALGASMLAHIALVSSLVMTSGPALAERAARVDSFWCAINPSNPRLGPSVELSGDNLHIVSANQQITAKTRLIRKPFVRITPAEAAALSGINSFTGKNIYLVRASAFYLSEDYSIKSKMAAFLYPDAHALEVTNYSLSRPGTLPSNFAIVVSTDMKVEHVDVTCHTAA